MFKVGAFRSSHPSRIAIRISRTYSFRRPLSQRFHGPLFRRSKETTSLALRCQHAFSGHRPMMRHTNKHTIQPRTIYVQPMSVACSSTGETPPQPPRCREEPARKPRHAQFLSGLLKSVVVALVGITKTFPCSIGPIRAARKRPRIFKVMRAVRKRCLLLIVIRNSLAFVAFAVFIVWDIRNLPHDEPMETKIKKTVREDPAAALEDAREELRRMMREERSRC